MQLNERRALTFGKCVDFGPTFGFLHLHNQQKSCRSSLRLLKRMFVLGWRVSRMIER